MKKYKVLSILAIILAFAPNFIAYNNALLSIYYGLSVKIWITALIFGIISTTIFIKNIKDIKIYWLIPAILSIVLNLGFLFVNV